MDILEYTEDKVSSALEYLRGSYDDLYERLHKVVIALVGGGGAVGAYSLGRISAEDFVTGLPLAAMSVGWFAIALYVLLFGPQSRELSPGNGPKNILRYYDDCLAAASTDDDSKEARALAQTRREELRLQQKRLREFADACTERASILDRAYNLVVMSPILPLAVLSAIAIYRFLGGR